MLLLLLLLLLLLPSPPLLSSSPSSQTSPVGLKRALSTHAPTALTLNASSIVLQPGGDRIPLMVQWSRVMQPG